MAKGLALVDVEALVAKVMLSSNHLMGHDVLILVSYSAILYYYEMAS